MNTEQEAVDFVKYGAQDFLSQVVIDCAIFGFHDQQLKILLLKWKGYQEWGLPGGFIRQSEPVSQAAHRILQERTSLSDLFLQQFHLFGDSPYRTRRRSAADFKKIFGYEIEADNWLLERTLSIGYFALVDYSKVVVNLDFFTEEYRWWDVNELPLLLFDHQDVAEKALLTLRLQIFHQPIGSNLLPEKFTLPEIQGLYETLLGKELDRRNFPKKLMALGIIKKLEERRHIGAHRSPYLYQYDQENYKNALKEGIIHAY